MPLLTDQPVSATVERIYHVHVPEDPPQATVPAIVVFHGGGQDVKTIASRWGVTAGNPVPADVENYLLVFPEADPALYQEWIHFQAGQSGFPVHDLRFVEALLGELTTQQYATGSANVPFVSADPSMVYAAGFSNGGGMVWQLLNSDLSSRFQGFAAVGKALDPEKSRRYRDELAATGAVPAPAPVFYVHGTADSSFRPPVVQQEVALDSTYPAETVREMLDRNVVPAGPASTTLVPGSSNSTEVIVQSFAGAATFAMATVLNGGHNWPTPTTAGDPPVATHFNATLAIVEFWRQEAGLP